jgi:hypothetical protein
LAYKDPQQIERLVKRLYHPNFHFYIHVDLNFDIKPFEFLGDIPNVFFVKQRFKMIWASYRFSETLVFIMQDLLAKKNYDFISFFSGQDYPIKDTDEIYEYYLNNIGYSFISVEPQNSPWYEECRKRYELYHMTYYSFKGTNVLVKLINSLIPKRKFPVYSKVYGGPRATWLTLSAEAAHFLIKTINSNKALRRFGKFTWAPDEFFFPTILLNSHLKNKVILDSGRYIDWSEGGANPKIFTKDDFSALIKSEKLFARKFDQQIDTEILDLLDETHGKKYRNKIIK